MTQPVPDGLEPAPPPERLGFKKDGEVFTADAADAEDMLARGFVPASDAEVAEAQRRADFASNPLAQVSAGVLGAARTASLGLSDVALTRGAELLGGEDAKAATAQTLATFRDANKAATTVGEVAGFFTPALAARALQAARGGSALAQTGARALQVISAPAAAAATVGEMAGAAASGVVNAALGAGATGLAARLAQRAIPGAVAAGAELGLFGVGQAVSDASIENKPLTGEAVAASFTHSALLGAGLGAGIGAAVGVGKALKDTIAGSAVGNVLRAGKSAAESTMQGLRTTAKDAPGLVNRLADDQAIQAITGNYVKSGRLIDEAERMTPGFRKEFAEWVEREIPAAAGRPNLAAVFEDELKLEAATKLREATGERVGNAYKALDAIPNARPNMDRAVDRVWDEVIMPLLNSPGKSPIADEVYNYIRRFDSYIGPARSRFSFEQLHGERRFLDNEKVRYSAAADTTRNEVWSDVRNILERELIESGDAAAATVGGDFSTAYKAAKKDFRFAATAHDSLVNKVQHGHKNSSFSITDPLWAGVGGSVGGVPGAIIGAAANQVRKRAGNELAAVALRQTAKVQGLQAAADTLMRQLDLGIARAIRVGHVAAAIGKRAEPLALPFDRAVHADSSRERIDKDYRTTLSRVRLAAADPEGTRVKVRERLAPVVDASPAVADHTVAAVMRGVSFLGSKAPVAAMRADTLTPHLDEPRASQDEKARFVRYARAVDNPLTVVDDLRAGKITREGVEAVREVYPQLYAQIQQAAVTRLADLTRPISYAQRVQLSILLGVPGDPSLQPKALSALQATYGTNTGGGGASSPSAGGQATGAQAQGPQLRRALNLAQATQTATQALEAE